MKTIPMNLTIDRHISNGSAAIRGTVNGQDVQMQVERGVEDGNAYVNGQVGDDKVGDDKVALTFRRSVTEGYESAEGQYGKTKLNSTIRRYQPDGDTAVTQNGRQLYVDRQNQGQQVALQSPVVGGGFQRQLKDGDEAGRMSVGRSGFDYRIDRDERFGGFVLSGQGDGGAFRLEGQRSGGDGDLTLSGTVPEGLKLFPLLWEVLGDDKNIPDRNPEYLGSVMAMSLFYADQG